MFERVVRVGTLRLIDASGRTHVFGNRGQPDVTIRLHERRLERRLLLSPQLCVGEAYMDGTLTIEVGPLRDLIRLGWLNGPSLGAYPTVRAVAWGLRGLSRLREGNSIGKARYNASHHYDLGNDVYEQFLDRDLQYSCAYFSSPDEGLEVAQERKKRHIAAKLCLEPGQRILDIGCGWGGLALSLAEWADVEVVGVTLAGEQHRIARERARALGLPQSQLTFFRSDRIAGRVFVQ